MSTNPRFHAEHRPERYHPDAQMIDLIRAGEPDDPTADDDTREYRDRGAVYGLPLADAVALRDSLTAAIEAARLVKAPRTCWTCRWARGQGCVNPKYHDERLISGWVDTNTDKDAMPLPTATPCPGFGDRP